MVHAADILALLAAGRTPKEASEALHCPVQRVYDAKWASRHPKRAPYVRPKPRHDLAVNLLDSGLTQEQAAAEMHVSVRTIQAYSAGSRGTGRRPGAPNDVNVERPRCPWCSLSLPCTCTGPLSAVEFMGRTDAPIAHSTGNHFG